MFKKIIESDILYYIVLAILTFATTIFLIISLERGLTIKRQKEEIEYLNTLIEQCSQQHCPIIIQQMKKGETPKWNTSQKNNTKI